MARSGNYRRQEIAHACGFYDGSHLNREFKRFFKHPLGPLAE
jgi:AraC-like DNA-binding protein